MRGYLTPPSLPVGTVGFCVYVPDDDIMIANFRGALTQFEYAWNWENVDGITPDQAVSVWQAANALSWDLSECGGGTMIPVGTVLPTASASLPTGCLWCDGSLYDPSAYPELFAAIGYVWDQDGSLFGVPDMTDSYPKGAGSEGFLGNQAGNNNSRDVPLPEHTHDILKGRATGQSGQGVQVLTLNQSTYMTSEPEGLPNAQIDIEGRRTVFNWYIVAEST